jgi:hypothetical protein
MEKLVIPEKLFLMMGDASRNAFLLVSIFFSKSLNTKDFKEKLNTIKGKQTLTRWKLRDYYYK